uniref:Uncharacterized protein n=1 Tax=Opuntia streptacantha TaxID=393608 RepID=A0A7C8ZSQ7_OPUST
MSNMRSKDRRSLCEESMLVFVNILKLSSLSLAKRALVPRSSDDHDQNPLPKEKTDHDDEGGTTPPFVPVPQPQRSKRSQQQPESQLSYVMLPKEDLAAASLSTVVDGQFSEYIRRFHEKTNNDIQNAIVEGKAADYIKRFHEKNLNDLNNESMMRRPHFVLPPPPRKVFK